MVGRYQETKTLDTLLKKKKADLLVISGRRRVGKTYLIRKTLAKKLHFEFTGTHYGDMANQLEKFNIELHKHTNKEIELITSWNAAFLQLTKLLEQHKKRKHIIFLDEFPWMATPRSSFLEEFSYWWNTWASQENILVIICGSAASWMMKKVINNKGGLHNRVTKRIHLKPFTLAETKLFLASKKINFTNYQILQLYMVTGGIPFYLEEVTRGYSATQLIDQLCFQKDGLLRNEFNNLYAALFDNHEKHIAIIKALASKWKGLSRKEILHITKLKDGGSITNILDELEASDFIMEIYPFGKKKKDKIYRLIDEYSLFYLKFVQNSRMSTAGKWMQLSTTNSYKIWAGYAFENICIKHYEAIKQALGISGIYSEVSSHNISGNKERKGLQIDMLLDRADNTINICEMKHYNTEWKLTKTDAEKLRKKRENFRRATGTKKLLLNTVISLYGLADSPHAIDQVDQDIRMDVLFEQKYF